MTYSLGPGFSEALAWLSISSHTFLPSTGNEAELRRAGGPEVGFWESVVDNTRVAGPSLSTDHGVPCLFLQSTSKPVEISDEPHLYGDEKSQFEPFDQVSGRSEPDKTFSG